MKKFLVVMAGGEGSRVKHLLENTPKQFVKPTLNNLSLLDQSIERARLIKKDNQANIIVLIKEKFKPFLETNKFDVDFVVENESTIGTTSAMFSLIHDLSKKHGDSVLAFFPSDHLIEDNAFFSNIVSRAMRLAEKSKRIFLLGSFPEEYSSAFGYIIPDLNNKLTEDSFFVKTFIEKPSQETLELIRQGPIFTNLGIFIGTATSFLHAYLDATTKNKDSIKNASNFDKDILENFVTAPVVLNFNSEWSDFGAILLNGEKEKINNSDCEINALAA